MSTGVPRIRLVESRLITARDYVDGIIPTQMWITKTGGENLRNQPSLDLPAFYTADFSLKKSMYDLIKRTEARCTPLEDVPTDTNEQNDYMDFSRNLNGMIYEGIENFLGMDLAGFNHYTIPDQYRFKQTFLNSRRFDSSWHSLLENWAQVKTIHPSIEVMSSESNYALNWYMTRKLETNNPMTTLDAYIVANCYHAELTFYKASFDKEIGDWRFTSKNVYNHNPKTKKRPKWGIVFDIASCCYFPILSDITSDMYLGYKPGEYGSLLMHSDPILPCILK